MKTMDAGRAEIELAAKAGANVAFVLGAAAVVSGLGALFLLWRGR